MKDKKVYNNYWVFTNNKYKSNCDVCCKKIKNKYPVFITKRAKVIGPDRAKQRWVAIHFECATPEVIKTAKGKALQYVLLNSYFNLLKNSLTDKKLRKNQMLINEIEGLNVATYDPYLLSRINEIKCIKQDLSKTNWKCPRCKTNKNVHCIDKSTYGIQKCMKCKMEISSNYSHRLIYTIKTGGYTVVKFIHKDSSYVNIQTKKRIIKTFEEDVFPFKLTNRQILKKIRTYLAVM